MMQVKDWLSKATAQLTAINISSARLDSLILLEETLERNRAWILGHPEAVLSHTQQARLNRCLDKRSRHIPLSYIRQKVEFYGREFFVDEHVLQPRPESEQFIELVKEKLQDMSIQELKSYTVLDIGTGSGALAISVKLEIPTVNVIATDISQTCITIAAKNARKYSANIQCIRANLLTPTVIHTLHDPVKTILMANLPYVPRDLPISAEARFEPKRALFSGMDGLSHYRRLFKQLSLLHDHHIIVMTESLAVQHGTLVTIAKQCGYSHCKTQGLIQVFNPVD